MHGKRRTMKRVLIGAPNILLLDKQQALAQTLEQKTERWICLK